MVINAKISQSIGAINRHYSASEHFWTNVYDSPKIIEGRQNLEELSFTKKNIFPIMNCNIFKVFEYPIL
ncbi:hypothetical protein D1632_11155 [Chryseobacterium nematophagum]|uniref:Uncharacterized protein n=1 Tax=Chryseobacterium nematophagum TaxID=2305228 RepID=A0A3M7LF41_9FLAO|nr:hypothetical protein [Chryseobacterium nematophagum]RMZ60136.1 hypothetical protein D1632_11155 [Chryseobacterium nematophagum]